ncbi:hypothetical protein PG987_006012 [Apiospora arundinis]
MERANVPGYLNIVNSVFDKPKSPCKLTVFMPGFTMSCLRSLGLLGQAIKRVKNVNPYSMLCMKVPYALKVNHQIQLIDHAEMGTDLKQESAEVYFKSMEEIVARLSYGDVPRTSSQKPQLFGRWTNRANEIPSIQQDVTECPCHIFSLMASLLLVLSSSRHP